MSVKNVTDGGRRAVFMLRRVLVLSHAREIIEEMLAGGLLLDGSAASTLQAMGYGGDIGVDGAWRTIAPTAMQLDGNTLQVELNVSVPPQEILALMVTTQVDF